MFQNNLIAGAAGQQGGFYPYEVGQSLRFNDDDSAYLSRTPASAGNRKTWTWSGWVKRGNLGGNQKIFQTRNDANNSQQFGFEFRSDDTLRLLDQSSGATRLLLDTVAVFRDTSAWYHFVVAVDTTQVTDADRVKLYVNGIRITEFSNPDYHTLNADTAMNDTVRHLIGAQRPNSSPVLNSYFDGYIADPQLVEGLQLDPTSFGEFKSDIWVPKAYTGSYGTNGFYLTFEDGAAIGDDLSGNTNDWTANNLAATDVVLDSPTNNYCTLNPLSFDGTGVTLYEGNLEWFISSNTGEPKSAFEFSSGKWYCEITVLGGNNPNIGWYGITDRATGDYAIYYGFTGAKWISGVQSAYGATYTTGDIIGIAYDADTGDIEFFKNGVSQGVFDTGFAGRQVAFQFTDGGSGSNTHLACVNFGQDSSFAGNKTAQGNTDANGQGDFYYTPPAGFLALNTANLPAPAIDPAVDDVPADYFNTVLYTGNGSTQSITGVGFQPDLVWGKNRSTANSNTVLDVVRGVGEILFTNTTDAGTAEVNNVTSFDADGFSLGNSANFNGNGNLYVGWNWLAGNGTASNTDGTITSTVSVNQKAGFSIVGYTGTGATSSGVTIGHGLGATPAMIITKKRTGGTDYGWSTWHKDLGGNYGIWLDKTNARNPAMWDGYTNISSTVFSPPDLLYGNESSANYINYLFAEVEGFSKFGSYIGNASTDGPFVYCGFRPAFVMTKRTDSTQNWSILDNKRDPDNVLSQTLFANTSDAENNDPNTVDFLSNGFKFRDGGTIHNGGGATYIFMAFSEAPFKYSNAR